MTDTALRLRDELLRLPEEDRIELANVLWESVEDVAWEAELDRRVAEIESGTAVGRPAQEVFDDLRKRYA
jgi:putative addiction module component (TIGR02574 family)